MLWSVFLASLVQLSSFWPLSDPCAPSVHFTGRSGQEVQTFSALCGTAQQQLTHQSFMSIFFLPKPKPSIVTDTMKKINTWFSYTWRKSWNPLDSVRSINSSCTPVSCSHCQIRQYMASATHSGYSPWEIWFEVVTQNELSKTVLFLTIAFPDSG